jgi:hypothetical protein
MVDLRLLERNANPPSSGRVALRRARRVAVSVTLIVGAACSNGAGDTGTTSDPALDAGAGSPAGGGATPSLGGTSGTGGGDCSGPSGVAGCPCGNAGQSAACWTGPPAQRGVGACHDGTSQCVMRGEFAQWGPCTGEETDCGSPDKDSGVRSEEAGTKDSSSGDCACVPGAVIWCDEDCEANVYCSLTAQKNCLPDGTWGACHETTTQPPIGACKHVGLGCSSCNGGLGYYTGDCQQQLACDPHEPTQCSVTANNGVVTCDCH